MNIWKIQSFLLTLHQVFTKRNQDRNMLNTRKHKRRSKHLSFRRLQHSLRAIPNVCGLEVKMCRAVSDNYV